ncbi:unnamed protein product, partial [Ceratitis capitata]
MRQQIATKTTPTISTIKTMQAITATTKIHKYIYIHTYIYANTAVCTNKNKNLRQQHRLSAWQWQCYGVLPLDATIASCCSANAGTATTTVASKPTATVKAGGNDDIQLIESKFCEKATDSTSLDSNGDMDNMRFVCTATPLRYPSTASGAVSAPTRHIGCLLMYV